MEMDRLSNADPVKNIEIDSARLRAMVDARIQGSVSPVPSRWGPPWLRAVAAFVLVLAVFVPVAFVNRVEQPTRFVADAPEDLAGVAATIGLEGGGVKTVAVDGDTIWVMNALQRRLDKIDSASQRIESQYSVDAYVEGVAVGGGYVWLSSYDDGGQLLRFDPEVGDVNLVIPTDGVPTKTWFGDRLWVSTEAGSLLEVSAAGETLSTRPGRLEGTGLGRLWIYDPETRSILALAEDGTDTGLRIGPESLALGGELSEVREVVAVGEYLWLVAGERGDPSAAVIRFDPATGELLPLDLIGAHGATEFDGSLWVTSVSEHLLERVDPVTNEVETYALPGRPGAVFDAGGSMWVALYQPGALTRLEPERLLVAGERFVDQTIGNHRLVCTARSLGISGSATVILDPNGWIGHASWSMVQAELSSRGISSCSAGYLGDPRPPAERAAGLEAALEQAGLEGPFVLVAAIDGVHSTRLFANGRGDIAGVVLVDPVPPGFQSLYDSALPGLGHPPWADIDTATSDSLNDFGDVPLVVIGQDPERTFLNPGFRQGGCCDADGNELPGVSEDTARRINDAWQAGLDSYAGLSSDSERVTAVGSGFDMILWEQPDLVAGQVDHILELSAVGGG